MFANQHQTDQIIKYTNNFTYTNFEIEEQNQILSSQRSNNFLSTNKLQTMYPQLKTIKESVLDIMKKYNKST